MQRYNIIYYYNGKHKCMDWPKTYFEFAPVNIRFASFADK